METQDKKNNPLAAEDAGKPWQFVSFERSGGPSFVKFEAPYSDMIAEAVEHPNEEFVAKLTTSLDDEDVLVMTAAYQALEKIAGMKGDQYRAARKMAKQTLAAYQRTHWRLPESRVWKLGELEQKQPVPIPVKRGNGMFASGRR